MSDNTGTERSDSITNPTGQAVLPPGFTAHTCLSVRCGTDRRIGRAELTALFRSQRRDMAGYVAEFTELLALHATLADRVIDQPALATVAAAVR